MNQLILSINLIVFSTILPIVVSCEVTTQLIEKYSDLWDHIDHPFREQLSHLISTVGEDASVNITNKCRDDLKLFAHELLEKSDRALMMLDSFTQRRTGSIPHYFLDHGKYDECEQVIFQGQQASFHLLLIKYPLQQMRQMLDSPISSHLSDRTRNCIKKSMVHHNFPFLCGICLPSSCSESDVNRGLNSTKLVNQIAPITLTVEKPLTNDSYSYFLVKFMCKVLIFLIILINAVASLYDVQKDTMLGCFNLRNNWRSFIAPPSTSTSSFICYLKIFFMLHATYSHLYLTTIDFTVYFISYPYAQGLSFYETRFDIESMRSKVSVKFVISAALSMLRWHAIISARSISFIQFIIIRVLRTLPLMIFFISCLIILPDFSFSNPLLNIYAANASTNCYESGVYEMLFISNRAVTYSQMCNRVNWFVSIDMQFYIISFFLLIHLIRSNKIYKSLAAASILSIISSFYTLYANRSTIKALLIDSESVSSNASRHLGLFFTTELHALGYVCGLWLGVQMTRTNQRTIKRSMILFILSLIFTQVAYYVPFFNDLNSIDSLTFVATWLIQQIGMTIGQTLSVLFLWSSVDSIDINFIPFRHVCASLARLEYAYFLVHPVVMMFIVASLSISFTSLTCILITIVPVLLISTIVVSTLLHLTVEMPFARLLNLWVKTTISLDKKKDK